MTRVISQFYTGSHGTWCCACWKWLDWLRDTRWSHRGSCSSRGKLPLNKRGIFTVCPIAVYPTAAWSRGNFNRPPQPRRPYLRRRKSNTAGTYRLPLRSRPRRFVRKFLASSSDETLVTRDSRREGVIRRTRGSQFAEKGFA